MTQIYHYT